MPLRNTARALLVAALMSVTAIAIAQPAPDPVPAEPAKPADAPVVPAVKLSLPEMRARSVEVKDQLQGDFQHVSRLKEVAVKKADVIKRNCVNDKLVQLKPLMNIVDSAVQNLEAEADETAAGDLFKQVTDAGESSRMLREEANGCMGELELYKQEAGVDVVRPDVMDDPGTIEPTSGDDLIVEVEPPGYASPFN